MGTAVPSRDVGPLDNQTVRVAKLQPPAVGIARDSITGHED